MVNFYRSKERKVCIAHWNSCWARISISIDHTKVNAYSWKFARPREVAPAQWPECFQSCDFATHSFNKSSCPWVGLTAHRLVLRGKGRMSQTGK
jgi:hypothetical protein